MTTKINNYIIFLATINMKPTESVENIIKNKKITFICNLKHTTSITLNVFGNKKSKFKKTPTFMCTQCKKLADNIVSMKKIQDRLTNGHIITSYLNNKSITYKCGTCNSVNKTTSTNLLRSTEYCSKCISKTRHVKWEDVVSKVEDAGMKINMEKSEYKNNKSVSVICSCGSPTRISLNDIKRGRKCLSCKTENTYKTNNIKYGCNNVFENSDIKKKSIATSIRKYGVNHPSKHPSVQKKKEETCLKNHGTKWYFCKDEIYEKIRKTHFAKYGVNYPLQSTDIQAKIDKVFIEKMGVKRPMLSEQFGMWMLEKYGNENYVLTDDYKKKMVDLYGNESPMRCPELFRKAAASSYRRKKYINGKKEYYVLGYEPRCLDKLFQDGKLNTDVFAGEDKEIPFFEYNCGKCVKCKNTSDNIHIYYPDVYIKSENRIIEVKSTWTLLLGMKNIYSKMLKVSEKYVCELWVYDAKNLLELCIVSDGSDLKKLFSRNLKRFKNYKKYIKE
jgi:hypothetical protein